MVGRCEMREKKVGEMKTKGENCCYKVVENMGCTTPHTYRLNLVVRNYKIFK